MKCSIFRCEMGESQVAIKGDMVASIEVTEDTRDGLLHVHYVAGGVSNSLRMTKEQHLEFLICAGFMKRPRAVVKENLRTVMTYEEIQKKKLWGTKLDGEILRIRWDVIDNYWNTAIPTSELGRVVEIVDGAADQAGLTSMTIDENGKYLEIHNNLLKACK